MRASPAKILIAEDDPNVLQLLEHFLSGLGYQVVTAKDGKEALDALPREKPDVLISDVMMPRMNGYQLVHAVMNDLHDVPAPKIILLTSRAEATDVQRGLTVGADVYIAKPFDLEDVAAQVKELVSQSPASRRVS